ncbi:hypothetical protein [Proteus mirabilis]|uniref:hypothetical protein n=1 Tax=Proteus mirabilis TaxID=584 RepID=UPI0034D54CF4
MKMKTDFYTYGKEIRVGNKCIVKSVGYNLPIDSLELEVLSIKGKRLFTSTGGNAIRPMSKNEVKNTYIVWDLNTGKRVHPTPMEDNFNYFFIPAIPTYNKYLLDSINGKIKK